MSMISRGIPGERLRLVRRPFKLAVELTGGSEDGQFANASSQPRFVPEIAVDRPGASREVGAVQHDPAGAPQTPDRPALGVGEAVVDTLPCIIKLLAPRQRQPAAGHWIDIIGIHGFPSTTGASSLADIYSRPSCSRRQAPCHVRRLRRRCCGNPGRTRRRVVRFAQDSPLEGDRFEPSVPRRIPPRCGLAVARRQRLAVDNDDCAVEAARAFVNLHRRPTARGSL